MLLAWNIFVLKSGVLTVADGCWRSKINEMTRLCVNIEFEGFFFQPEVCGLYCQGEIPVDEYGLKCIK